MIQVNRIYLIFNRLVTKKFLVDTSVYIYKMRTVEIEYLFSAALIRVISYLVSFVIYPFLIFIHLLSFSVL